MDYNLQQTVTVLLHKAGDSSSFIREAVNSSLTSMVENVSPGRALTALTEGGLCHKNTIVYKYLRSFGAIIHATTARAFLCHEEYSPGVMSAWMNAAAFGVDKPAISYLHSSVYIQD
ncbi:TOG array regulator of axonemal microtubules protein 2-like [Bufo bufo]|uniref:TOG array regulator of axonemal microtubules protein 2-like n=1 Tax=Bufo bufo TaxID=8384 RepID=UPI001ABEE810|nr:TOG array regulator of axonemal microtubules protein 2-like [Bufo bufo]